MYHGEGELVHCSGYSYQGMWIHGTPAGRLCMTMFKESIVKRDK